MVTIAPQHTQYQEGFTLAEVLVALLMGGVVMAAVMSSFQIQHRTYLAQDQVVEMQQNVRVAMDMMVRDIRTAGYNPNNLDNAGITVANAQILTFSRFDDVAGLETISYSLFDAFASASPPRNDGLIDDLARQVTNAGGGSSGRQLVAENISQLEFRYLDANGNPTAVLNDIRSIQVSILAESANMETKTTPARPTYTTPSGVPWQATPGFWNTYLSTTVQCRNLGLAP